MTPATIEASRTTREGASTFFGTRLSEAIWAEVADLDDDPAFLPVGSTEQHGPRASLGTDALNAESVAEIGTDAFGGEVVVGPTIPVSVAEEHRALDGTLWVSPNTFRTYIRETIESFVHHDFDRVVVVNGHGGNTDTLAEPCRRAPRAGDIYAATSTRFDAIDDHSSDMGHGSPSETALLRHTHPELVREDRVDEARDGGTDRWGEWISNVNLAYGSDEFADNDVVGDPAKGDADRGAELESLAADSLASLLDAVEGRKLG